MDFEFPLFTKALPSLLKGAVTTVQLASLSFAIGVALGVVVGVIGVSTRLLLRWPARSTRP
jgi:ABC-type amino acid transport system permease subunit